MRSTPRCLGLLGGMSWQSSLEYERTLNTEIHNHLGDTHSANLIIRSYDFHQIEQLQAVGDWDGAGRLLSADALKLQDAGAEMVLLCTNTMHKVADSIESALTVPFLHLADATADAILQSSNQSGESISTIALLGTRYTMEQDFYRARLEARGLQVLIPDEPDRTTIHDVIYTELVKGTINPDSKQAYLEAIDSLTEQGAQGVIAGCTEIELLIQASDLSVAYFPTAEILSLIHI